MPMLMINTNLFLMTFPDLCAFGSLLGNLWRLIKTCVISVDIIQALGEELTQSSTGLPGILVSLDEPGEEMVRIGTRDSQTKRKASAKKKQCNIFDCSVFVATSSRFLDLGLQLCRSRSTVPIVKLRQPSKPIQTRTS